jgi:hypothetical protein
MHKTERTTCHREILRENTHRATADRAGSRDDAITVQLLTIHPEVPGFMFNEKVILVK